MRLNFKNFKACLFISVALLLQACSHSVRLPGTLQERPVTAGHLFGGDVSVGWSKYQTVVVIKDMNSNPPVRPTGSQAADDTDLSLPIFNFSLGIFENLDLFVGSAQGAGARYRLVGNSKSEGLTSTIFAGYFSNTQTTETSSTTASSVSNPVDTAKTVYAGPSYGLSIGYNFSKSLESILYLTLGQQRANVTTTLKQASQTTEYEYKDKFVHSIATLGYSIGSSFYFNIEGSVVQTQWSYSEGNTETINDSTWLVGGGYRW